MGSELRCVSHLKNSLSYVSREATRIEPFPKTAIYCHLLPFCSRKTDTLVSIVLSCVFSQPSSHITHPRAGCELDVLDLGPACESGLSHWRSSPEKVVTINVHSRRVPG